jgi:hypothetical protein
MRSSLPVSALLLLAACSALPVLPVLPVDDRERATWEPGAFGIDAHELLAAAASARAADSFDGAASGLYIGAMLSLATVGGDFDGQTFVGGGGSAEVMPELETGLGWGLALGGRFEVMSFEINYQKTEHDGEFGGVPVDASFEAVNLDFKVHLFSESRVQPHILFGFGFPWLTVEDGSVASGGAVDDATFRGICANIGAGVTFYPSEQVGVFAQGGYRWASFDSVDGIVSGELAESVDGSGAFAAFGVTFTF